MRKLAVWSASGWNFRISDRRSILVKNKEKGDRRIFAEDTSTKTLFILELGEEVSSEPIEIGKTYNASINVYTAKSVEGVSTEFTELFQVLDVDRPMEDFVKATCCYPSLIRFEIVEIEDQDHFAKVD